MQLTKNFSLEEMTFSRKAAINGWDNTPNEAQQARLVLLCTRILQPLRSHLRVPVIVTSAFRSKRVNKAASGSPTSQHLNGEAADIHVPGMSIATLIDRIHMLHLPFDQLIDEFDQWVHISCSDSPRREEMMCRFVNGRRVYTRVENL